MKHLLLILIACCTLTPLAAQLQRIMHQSFTLDTLHHLVFALPGEYQVESWAGDNILTETKVQLYDASEGILTHFIEKGRYQLEAETGADTLRIFALDPERKPIRTLNGEASELVNLRIFIPEAFVEAGPGYWRKE